MAWTQADLDNVKARRAAGERTCTFADGKSITYKSDMEMAAVQAAIEKELALAASASSATWPSLRRIARFKAGIY